jgi:monoamine oxidase
VLCSQTVAVVGAGIAGLAAAVTLQHYGFNVIVIEAREVWALLGQSCPASTRDALSCSGQVAAAGPPRVSP